MWFRSKHRSYAKQLQEPLFLAAWSEADDLGSRFDRLALTASRFFEFSADQNICQSISRNIGLLTVEPTYSAFPQNRVWKDSNTHIASSHFIPALSNVSSKTTASEVDYLRSALSNSDSVAAMPPPVAVVMHDRISGTLVLTNDFLGSSKIYLAQRGSNLVASNRPEAIFFFLDETPLVNEKAWMQQASWDWILTDDTYFANISMLPPGRTVSMRADRYVIEETHSVGRYLREYKGRRLHASFARDAIFKSLDDAYSLAGGNVSSIGLSGGRDSRVIAAVVRELGASSKFHTSVPPMLESTIAQELVASSQFPMEWEQRPTARLMNAPKDTLLERGSDWVQRTAGDTWPSFVRNDFRQPPNSSKLIVSGGGGEVLRANFYSTSDLATPSNSVEQFIEHRGKYHPFLTPETRLQAQSALSHVIEEGREYEIDGLYLLDWFYIRSKQRRRVPIAFRPSNTFPLLNLESILASFYAEPRAKVEATFLRDFVAEFAPEWVGISYFHERAASLPRSITDKSETQSYHWEDGNRKDLLRALEAGLAASGDMYVGDLLDTFNKADRESPHALLLQHTADRIIWRAGFERFVGGINEALSARKHRPSRISIEEVF
jgi:hypothetical protein